MKEVFPYGKTLPINLSTQGSGIDSLIHFLHIFMFALFIGWGIYFVYVLWRFRARKGHKAVYEPVKAKTTKYLEIAVILIEVMLLFGLSMPIWAKFKTIPDKTENPIEIRVVAEQFLWNFHYPGKDGIFGKTDPALVDATTNPLGLDTDNDPAAADDFNSLGVMRVPAGKEVIAQITSKDVIHSFFIPVMRVKQDAVPGTRAAVWFKAKEPRYSLALTEGGEKPKDVVKAIQDVAPSLGPVLANDLITTPSLKPILRCVDHTTAEEGRKVIEAAGGKASVNATEFDIACAQLCGLGHYKMRGRFYIDTPEAYQAWAASSAPVVEAPAEEPQATPAPAASGAASPAPAAAATPAPAAAPSDPAKNNDGFDN